MPLMLTGGEVTISKSLILHNFPKKIKNMKSKKVKVTFEYTNPNTHSVVSVFAAIFGIVFEICLVVFCILWM